MANRESAKRAERRRRAKTTGVITLMLQAPRAGVVVALVIAALNFYLWIVKGTKK